MTAELHDDDRVPGRTALEVLPRAASRRRKWIIGIVVFGVAVALLVASVVVAFRRAHDDLAATRRDTAASATRVQSLTKQLATATDQRDQSRRAAAVAKAALEAARSAHLKGADTLASERADVNRARLEAYVSVLARNQRSDQLNALQDCLNGVSQALNRVAVGDVAGWQRTLESIDGVCKQAQAATA